MSEFDKTGNEVEQGVKDLGNAATKKATNGIKNGLKKIAKKVGKVASEAVKKVIVTLLPYVAIVLGIVLVIILILILFESIRNGRISRGMATPVSSDVQTIYESIIYNKYADQSYYFVLDEPSDEEQQNEKDNYSGKKYKQLNGEKNKGLTQGSITNYVSDVENYESKIRLNASRLKSLDIELNRYGQNDGVLYPEQFIKMVYVGDSCNPNADDFDIKACKLGDLDKAESTKFIEQTDGTYIASQDEKEKSVFDYGLGSLIHYQAYYQPYRVVDYKIETVSYVNDDWKFGDSADAIERKNWNSLSEEKQTEILEKYKYGNHTYQASVGTGEGLVDLIEQNQTGIYDVAEQIVRKNWEDIDAYKKGNQAKWGISEPGISTGLPQTEVVYAIDYALAYYGPVNLKVTQNWTDLGDADHVQTGTYIKDFVSDKSENFKVYNIPDNGNVEGLKRLIQGNHVVGFIKGDPDWVPATFEEYETPINGREETVKNDAQYCRSKLNSDDGLMIANEFSRCLSETHTKITSPTTSYTVVYIPGYWKYTIVRDENGIPVNREGKISYNANYSYTCEGKKNDDYYNFFKHDVNEGKYSDMVAWRYEPSYVFPIQAYTKGTLQVNLVKHAGVSAKITEQSLDYLKKYINNYKIYLPHENGLTYSCYTSSNLDNPAESMPYGAEVTIKMKETAELAQKDESELTIEEYCKKMFDDADYLNCVELKKTELEEKGEEDETTTYTEEEVIVSQTQNDMWDKDDCWYDTFALANNYGNTYHHETASDWDLNSLPDAHRQKIVWILGLLENEEFGPIEMNNESIEYSDTFDLDAKTKIAAITAKYSDELKNISGKYGIDKNLLTTMMYVGNELGFGTDNPGLFCDKGCKLEDVEILSSGINEETKDITINPSSNIIEFTAAKMQNLLEKYNGNVLIALLEFNVGEDATNKIFDIYKEQTGISKNNAIKDKYNTGWYHFVKEVVSKPEKYELTLSSFARENYVAMIVANMQTSSFIWVKRVRHWIDWTPLSAPYIASESWNKYAIFDGQEMYIENSENDAKTVEALYNLRKNRGKSYKEYWHILTAGQKPWESGIYAKKGEYNQKAYLDYASTYIMRENPSDHKVDHERQVEAIIKNSSSVCSYLDKNELSNCLDEIGSEDLDIVVDYKDVIGTYLAVPAKQYKTNEEDSNPEGKLPLWAIDVDAGEDIYSITSGVVQTVGNNSVSVYIENKKLLVKYNGLENIEVVKDDEIQPGTTLGKSKGEVYITISSIDDEFEVSYDMRIFINNFNNEQNESSRFFSNVLLQYLGGFSDKILSDTERDALWKEIYANLKIEGWTGDRQCTMFVNYMVQTYWGDAILRSYGQFLKVAGAGYQKVDALKNVYGNILVSPTTILPQEGSNIAFSWSDGGMGHTGWIHECKYDPDAEGHGYVIVSQGNIYDHGEWGNIQWQWRYDWDTWMSTCPEGSTQYIWLS